MSRVIHTLPGGPTLPYVVSGEGLYLHMKDGRKLLDMTAGSTASVILGWGEQRVLNAMKAQMDKICHIDYKVWNDENRDELAELLLSRAEHKLNRVYFSGQSGSDACEASMKLSYQSRYDNGQASKQWFISRLQSYHGATSDALAVGDRLNMNFFHPGLSLKRAKINEHNPYRCMNDGESLDDYAKRSAKELENKILEIGPENVCGFIGETIMGGLVGDVPPAPNYWKYVRAVCDKYDVHLILDEVWCGTGSSGKIYCCDWDGITPDFIFMGKTLSAGYAPTSIVVTSDKIENIIKNGQGRVQHGHTHQGHSLGVAATLAVQKIIHTDEMLKHINEIGQYMRDTIESELGGHPFFDNVRGRGLRFSFEYKCKDQHALGLKVAEVMEKKHNILISGKWHRIEFTPAFIITKEQASMVLERFIETFRSVSKDWESI